jgi:hypothetical protein
VIGIASLSCMRPEDKSVFLTPTVSNAPKITYGRRRRHTEAALVAPLVQACHVGEEVIDPVGVRRLPSDEQRYRQRRRFQDKDQHSGMCPNPLEEGISDTTCDNDGRWLVRPQSNHGSKHCAPSLIFGLVVDTVESYYTLQEDMQLRMARRILRDLEQRLEHIWAVRTISHLTE